MSPIGRFALLVAATLVLVPSALLARPQSAQPEIVQVKLSAALAVSPEAQLFTALNHERAAQGLPALQWDNALALAARHHADRMTQANQLSHQLPSEPDLMARAKEAGARYSSIAENVAVGPDPSSIHAMWMRSPGHRANILSPELTAVGIAVERGSAGLFAVQDFSRAFTDSSLHQQEQEVGSLLAARGLKVSTESDARASCDGNRASADNRPVTLVRYETPNLNKLPDLLERQLTSGRYRAAAVAACPVSDSSGFTSFRMAVLLF
jgi:uncharacterized protein YkwD